VTIPSPDEEHIARKYVFLIDLAEFLGRTGTALQAKARKLGINPVFIRREVSGKAALAVTEAEARRLIDLDIKSATILKPEDLLNA
jgi:hypothetical protein